MTSAPDVEPAGAPELAARAGAVAGQIRGSSLLLLGRMLSLALNLLTQVLIVRHLSMSGYGAFAYGLTLAAFAQTLVTPHHEVFARFLAIDDERGERARVAGTLLLGLVTSVGLGAVVIALGWLSRDVLAGSLDDRAAVDVVLVLIALAPLQALDQLFEALCAVVGRPGAIFVRKYVVAPLARLAAVVALLLADGGALFLAAGYVIAGVFGVAVYGTIVVALLRQRDVLRHLWPGRFDVQVRALGLFALPMLSASLVHHGVGFATVAALAHTDGTDAVAAVQAVRPAARLNELVSWSFGMLFVAMVSRFVARRDLAGVREAYWHTATWIAVLSFPVFVLTVPFAGTTTAALYGDRYEGSAPYLAVLASAYFLSAVLGLNAATLQVLGRIRLLLLLNLGVGLAGVAAALVATPRFGPAGAVGVLAGTLAALNLATQVGLARRLGMPLVPRAQLAVYGLLGLVAAGLGALRWALLDLAEPGRIGEVLVTLGLAGVAGLVAVAIGRRHLRLSEMFPEVRRAPVVGRWL